MDFYPVGTILTMKESVYAKNSLNDDFHWAIAPGLS